jgi:hypothetical protein
LIELRSVICFLYVLTDAYDPVDPNGNIIINWDFQSIENVYTVRMPASEFSTAVNFSLFGIIPVVDMQSNKRFRISDVPSLQLSFLSRF